ncbi:hypothetical protein ACA910_004065 [Epithemia clementina (nom. ined.)]
MLGHFEPRRIYRRRLVVGCNVPSDDDDMFLLQEIILGDGEAYLNDEEPPVESSGRLGPSFMDESLLLLSIMLGLLLESVIIISFNSGGLGNNMTIKFCL